MKNVLIQLLHEFLRWCHLSKCINLIVGCFSWENRQQYVDSICQLRMTELRSGARMQAIRAGLASVVPVQLLPLMTHRDVELRTCGLPEVNLEFLKVTVGSHFNHLGIAIQFTFLLITHERHP